MNSTCLVFLIHILLTKNSSSFHILHKRTLKTLDASRFNNSYQKIIPSKQKQQQRQSLKLESTSNSQSHVEIFHQRTNTTVILIGCLHGSISSANDVNNVLRDANDDNNNESDYHNTNTNMMIVLELCAGRYKHLQRDMMSQLLYQDGENLKSSSSSLTTTTTTTESIVSKPNKLQKQRDFISMVNQTIQKRGLSTGVAAAILGSISGLQTALSGFQPGLEFRIAMDYVFSHPYNTYGNNNRNQTTTSIMTNQQKNLGSCGSCDVILADRTVEETLRRVGSLPKISIDMFREFIESRFCWEDTYGRESRALLSAIWGDDNLQSDKNSQVDMGKVLVRNQQAVTDLIRLTVPPLLFIELLTVSLNTVLNSVWNFDSIQPYTGYFQYNEIMNMHILFSRDDWIKLFGELSYEIFFTGFFLFLGFVIFVLPSVRIILVERDDHLAQGIISALEVLSNKQNQYTDGYENNNKKKLVAVLGLLHVNGVAKQIMADSSVRE